jgi:hypothetical protein
MQNPAMAAAIAPERHALRLVGLVTGGLMLVAALAALVLFLWLRTYAPLSSGYAGGFAPGPGLGADVEPVTGSGGKTVFIPVYRKGRPFDTAFTLHNTGRFAVTVEGLVQDRSRPELEASALLASDSSIASADPANVHAFHRLRLDPGDTAIVVVRWRLDCSAGREPEVYSDSVPLRFRYLSTFTRTQSVRLPFAVTLRCRN